MPKFAQRFTIDFSQIRARRTAPRCIAQNTGEMANYNDVTLSSRSLWLKVKLCVSPSRTWTMLYGPWVVFDVSPFIRLRLLIYLCIYSWVCAIVSESERRTELPCLSVLSMHSMREKITLEVGRWEGVVWKMEGRWGREGEGGTFLREGELFLK